MRLFIAVLGKITARLSVRGALPFALVLALLTGGCTEPLSVYRVAGQSISSNSRILVLPFMDTRTFTDPKDPYRENLGPHARDIFVAAMRDNPICSNSEILTPDIVRPEGSLTIAEVADFGRRHDADFVVAGQVFSFTGTRAASIPPRAGMFIRVVSAKTGSLVFVGDHYQSAPVPGAMGGRELQATGVSKRLIDGFVAGIEPLTVAALRSVASSSAFAMPTPDRARASGNDQDDMPLPPPPLPVFDENDYDYSSLKNIEAPEIPLTLHDDSADETYAIETMDYPATELAILTGKSGSKKSAPLRTSSAPVKTEPERTEPDYVADAPEPLAPPSLDMFAAEEPETEDAAPSLAESDGTTDGDAYDEAAVLPDAEPDSDEPVVAEGGPEREENMEERVVEADAAADAPLAESAPELPEAAFAAEHEPEETPVVATERIAEPEIAVAAAEAVEPEASDDSSAREAQPVAVVEEEVEYADSYAMKSGDDLAADLFESEGGLVGAGFVSPLIPPPVVAPPPAADPVPVPEPVIAPLPELAEGAEAGEEKNAPVETAQVREEQPLPPVTSGTMTQSEYFAMLEGASASQPEVPAIEENVVVAAEIEESALVAVDAPVVEAPVAEAPVVEAAATTDSLAGVAEELSDEPVVSELITDEILVAMAAEEENTPLVVEQPKPVRMVNMVELPDDPGSAGIGTVAEVAVPVSGTANGGIKVLLLPYHDRENPNNLIAHTGGGEVVTALVGARLARESGIQVMWPGGWMTSHNRLVTTEEALQIAKLSGVDYVIRGQVVEFRRAQSVPSFYSAVISTAVLAAQIVFAEISGVDVATEVYRVSDGMCIMSRRDRSQQKYVVQAEKTVRRIADGLSAGVAGAILGSDPEQMDPCIDFLEPITLLPQLFD